MIEEAELTPEELAVERFAHAAALKIRPEVSGDAEYWRIRAAIAEAIDAGIQYNRAAIVAWLRGKALECDKDGAKSGTRVANKLAELSGALRMLADAIERGDHLSGQDK